MNNIDVKKYRREWAILGFAILLLFMMTLVFLVFTKNIHFLFRPLYTQICKIRGGEMIDQGPIVGCFIKDKKIGLCSGIKLENGKIMGDCVY